MPEIFLSGELWPPIKSILGHEALRRHSATITMEAIGLFHNGSYSHVFMFYMKSSLEGLEPPQTDKLCCALIARKGRCFEPRGKFTMKKALLSLAYPSAPAAEQTSREC